MTQLSPFAKEAVRLFKALADPTRYEIVRSLAQREEVSCQEFLQGFSLSPSALSHHFRVLESCGLIEVRREGAFHFYRLNQELLERHVPRFAVVHEGLPPTP